MPTRCGRGRQGSYSYGVTSDEDAETAGNVLYTLLCNLGLLKEQSGAPRLTVEELLKETKTTAQAYVKELVEA